MTWQCPPSCTRGPCAALIVLGTNTDALNVWRVGWGHPPRCARGTGDPCEGCPPASDTEPRCPLAPGLRGPCCAENDLRLRPWLPRDFRQMTLQQRGLRKSSLVFPCRWLLTHLGTKLSGKGEVHEHAAYIHAKTSERQRRCACVSRRQRAGSAPARGLRPRRRGRRLRGTPVHLGTHLSRCARTLAASGGRCGYFFSRLPPSNTERRWETTEVPF